jgi:hypothetical protein
VLAAAVDVARNGILGITRPETLGIHLAVKSEGERVVTHLFECNLAGYLGWTWFAVLTRNSRSKIVTVSEVGMLPSAASILAPEWVPWAERVRPEDEEAVAEFAAVIEAQEAEAQEAEAQELAEPGDDDADDTDADDTDADEAE